VRRRCAGALHRRGVAGRRRRMGAGRPSSRNSTPASPRPPEVATPQRLLPTGVNDRGAEPSAPEKACRTVNPVPSSLTRNAVPAPCGPPLASVPFRYHGHHYRHNPHKTAGSGSTPAWRAGQESDTPRERSGLLPHPWLGVLPSGTRPDASTMSTSVDVVPRQCRQVWTWYQRNDMSSPWRRPVLHLGWRRAKGTPLTGVVTSPILFWEF
jgi:hypothetical protein